MKEPTSRSRDLGAVYLRGLAMGAADVVPGVSGGTIAFVSGIYERLIDALTAITPGTARLLLRGEIRHCWQIVDGNFLLTLLAGILTSIFTLARLLHDLLETHPHLVWAFFLGLVIASTLHLGRASGVSRPTGVLSFMAGIIVASVVVRLPELALSGNAVAIFVSGAIAICAMVLPGISGSFMLLLMGMYAPTLAAVSNFDIAYLVLFAAGCLCGLLGFTQLLRWLLHRFHDATIMLLTGFLAGSLPMLWPWQFQTAGAGRFALWPSEYTLLDGPSAQAGFCLLLALAGALLVGMLGRLGTTRQA